MSKVLVVVAQQHNPLELWPLLGELSNRGFKYEVVSDKRIVWDERSKKPHSLERTYYELDPKQEASECEGLALILGGPRDMEFYWEDKPLQELIRTFKEEGKALAAACVGTAMLAPYAQGATLSCWPIVKAQRRIKQYGAIPTTVSLTVEPEHKIVTIENRFVSGMWAEEFCNLMEGKPQQYFLQDSGFQPNKKKRRMPPDVERVIARARNKKENGDEH